MITKSKRTKKTTSKHKIKHLALHKGKSRKIFLYKLFKQPGDP
jgi:hypothetical protein